MVQLLLTRVWLLTNSARFPDARGKNVVQSRWFIWVLTRMGGFREGLPTDSGILTKWCVHPWSPCPGKLTVGGRWGKRTGYRMRGLPSAAQDNCLVTAKRCRKCNWNVSLIPARTTASFFSSTVTAVTLLKEEPRGYGCWFVVIVESLDPLQCTYIDIGLVSCRL